jgi:DNA-binding MarR family transcriptional regulator
LARRFVLDQPGGNLALDLFVLSQHLGSMLEAAFVGTGVKPSQYAVYAQIAERERTPRQIGQTLGLAPATVSNYLNAIERRGHLVRTPSDADRRSHTVALTPSGVAKWQECRERMRTAVRELNARVGSAPERDALRAALGGLDEAILAVTERIAVPERADQHDVQRGESAAW